MESEATAADTDEPPLDELITAATHEYLDSGMTYDGFSEHVRTTWRNAAAYDWSKLMAEPRSTGEWSSDANRLAVLGVMMQFAPESTCMMIASDILAENAPLSLPALRERINTPDGMVNTDLLFSRLIDNGTTPDPARIDMAMGILGPLEANAPTDACYRIIGLKAMLSLAMGDGEKARELAEQAIGYGRLGPVRVKRARPSAGNRSPPWRRRTCGRTAGIWGADVDAVPRDATGPAG